MGDEEGVKDDVEEMNKSFNGELEESEAEEVEEVKEIKEVIVEEEKVDEPEEGSEEEEITEEVEDESNKEEEITEEEIPKEGEKDKTIAELRKRLEEKEGKEKEKAEEKIVEKEPTFESQDFLDKDEDLEDLIRDPKKLNEVFNNIYQRAVTDTRKTLGEGILRSIPDIVRSSVDMMDRLKTMNTEFYNTNEDLKPFKKVVAAVFEEVATKHPGKDMMDILPMVAEDARKRLELHKKATQTIERKSPKLPSRKRRTTIAEEKPNTNPLLNELEEMNKTLWR